MTAKINARKRDLEFTISKEDIVIPATCPVLGIELRRATGRRDQHSPTLDRIDNTRGYVRGNIVVVSWRANKLKSDATILELQQLAQFYSSKETHERELRKVRTSRPVVHDTD
jgi:hypothetical protein